MVGIDDASNAAVSTVGTDDAANATAVSMVGTDDAATAANGTT